MGHRQMEWKWASVWLLLVGVVACTVAFVVMSAMLVLKPPRNRNELDLEIDNHSISNNDDDSCCRGIPNLELWGAAVKWGTHHRFNSAQECCQSCKALCTNHIHIHIHTPCPCDSWVFCADSHACGHHFGECWLKKQTDALAPQRQVAGPNVMWTSGLIFGNGQGIIALETHHGTIHVKLYPHSAPYSVDYILELLSLRHCAGCQFYRAEGRGNSWDIKGNHIEDASFGPPFALIQGTLEAAGTSFNKAPTEVCQSVRRGAVAWVGSGPEFFISLANHVEWKQAYTVFGSVLPEDMEIVEKIAQLPTNPDVWNNVNVSVLETSIPISIHRI